MVVADWHVALEALEHICYQLAVRSPCRVLCSAQHSIRARSQRVVSSWLWRACTHLGSHQAPCVLSPLLFRMHCRPERDAGVEHSQHLLVDPRQQGRLLGSSLCSSLLASFRPDVQQPLRNLSTTHATNAFSHHCADTFRAAAAVQSPRDTTPIACISGASRGNIQLA